MTKTLTFNNGLFTGYSSSGSDMSTIKRVTFKNGLLTNMTDTSASKTSHGAMIFKNGLLTGIIPLVDPTPPSPPVPSVRIYIGSPTEHTLSIISDNSSWESNEDTYSIGGKYDPDAVGPFEIFGDDAVGYIIGVKNSIFTHDTTGYSRQVFMTINKDVGVESVMSETPTSSQPTNKTYVHRPTVSSTWWDTADISGQVYSLVDDIVSYTDYSDWCYQIITNERYRSVRCYIAAYGYYGGPSSIATYYQTTFFWAPIYYGIPPV